MTTSVPIDVDRAADLYRGGATLKEVAAEIGASKDAVRSALVAAGVELRAPRRRAVSDEDLFDVVEAVRLYKEDGLTIRQIADQLGASRTRIHRVVVASGVPRRTPKSPRACRITPAMRDEILAAWADGKTHHGIVRELRTTAETIDKVVAGAGLATGRRGSRRLDHDLMRRRRLEGWTLQAIADEVGSKPQYVWRVLTSMGVRVPPALGKRAGRPIDRERVVKLLGELGTIRRVAAELGVDRGRVAAELRAAGVDTSQAATWARRKGAAQARTA